MIHVELVALAARWLRGTAKCQVVFAEPTVQTYEMPDAIGWCGGQSLLIECKASQSDAYADSTKEWRQLSEGMGNFRYVMAPTVVSAGLGKWLATRYPRYGLLAAAPKRVRVILQPAWRELDQYASQDEREILAKSFHRVQQGRRFIAGTSRFEPYHDFNLRQLRREVG